jgi:hypothetical protein
MILMRLLSAGKSWVGMKETPGLYVMRRENLLPKFAPGRNPFAAPEANSNSKSAPVADESKAPAATVEHTAAPRPVEFKKKQRLPALTDANRPGRMLMALRWVANALGAAWHHARKMNPLRWWAGRRRVAKSGMPKFQKLPIQGELSLDRVKVVRNDLSDADLDVVTVQAAKAPVASRPDAAEQAAFANTASLEPAEAVSAADAVSVAEKS